MIYTSYFSNIRNLPENVYPVSISLWPPKWFTGKQIKNLAPSRDLLNWYKHADVSQKEKEERYTEEYNDFLREHVTADWMKKGLMSYFPETKDGKPIYESETDHVALCCFEKSGDFCHRNLLAGYLTSQGMPIHEIMASDIEQIKKKTEEYLVGSDSKKNEMSKKKTACFVGPSVEELCGTEDAGKYGRLYGNLVEYIDKHMYGRGCRRFITGGSQGFDQLAFWAVDSLKEKYSDIQNIIYAPYMGYENNWQDSPDSPFSKERYKSILQKADTVVYVCSDFEVKEKCMNYVMAARDQAMVDDSAGMVALYPDDSWNVAEYGVGYAMQYACQNDTSVIQARYVIDESGISIDKFRKVAFDKDGSEMLMRIVNHNSSSLSSNDMNKTSVNNDYDRQPEA